MGGMKSRGRLAVLVVTAITAFAATGCGGGGAAEDKAGGTGDLVTLRLANTGGSIDQTPAVEYFVKRVDELSAVRSASRSSISGRSSPPTPSNRSYRTSPAARSTSAGSERVSSTRSASRDSRR